MSKHLPRKLTAILYADVAGYSRLTGQDEDRTHQQLSDGLNILTETISAHGGSKVHEAGDAILAEFPSVTAAVDAAIESQKSMIIWPAQEAVIEQVRFRIGIHIGEVIHDRGDIYGDGVNIAARIQEIALPGSFCISSAVYEQLGRGKYNFDDLGYHNFKNIERPVQVYQLRYSELLEAGSEQNFEARVHDQPLFDDTFEMPPITTGRCACGSVKFEITQQSLGTAYCHCRICQRSIGAPVIVWTAFPIDAVKFTHGQPKFYRMSQIAEQGFCENCGSSLIWRRLKPGPANYLVIITTSLDNPEDYAPSWHGGVESQLPWFKIHDDLPRTRSDESPMLKSAWESAGLPDPNDWNELEYEQAALLDNDPELKG